MSALLNLAEAATALTQLVSPANWPPQSASALTPALTRPATSTAPPCAAAGALAVTPLPPPPTHQAHAVCDDAASARAALARMLQENHLQALRASAAQAGFTAATPYRGLVTPAAGALAMTHLPSPPTPQAASANAALARMAALRENHLQALRASAAAPLPPASTPYQGPVTPAFAGPAVTITTPPAAARDLAAKGASFPLRLHALLSDPSVRDVVSWLPHGRSFAVLRPADFATRVLPRYFAPEGSSFLQAPGHVQSPGAHKYSSFTRKLNRWGFRQIAHGPNAGAFCHAQFQRDLPELCRNICQKSRRPNRVPVSAADGGADDYSVSSASTMGIRQCVASGGKRPHSSAVAPYSSMVTVSTAGVRSASNKSLPLKKRKPSQASGFTMDDIPSTISHRQNQKWSEVPASTPPSTDSSVVESDLTSDTSSNSGASSRVLPKAAEATRDAAEQPPAVAAALDALTRHFQQHSDASTNAGASSHVVVPKAAKATRDVAERSPAVSAELDALARHFHQQRRAFVLASLMENSRLAHQAAGLNEQAASADAAPPPGSRAPVAVCQYSPTVGAVTAGAPGVVAPTVSAPLRAPASGMSAAAAAKRELYQAYLQALSSDAPSP